MKFIIQPQERKEFVNLPETGTDALVRAHRSDLLGQADRLTPAPDSDPERSEPPRDAFADFLSGPVEESESEPHAAASWKHSKWVGILPVCVLAVLGIIWYFAARSDSQLMLSEIRVEGANLLTSQEIISLAKIDAKVPFYQIDLKPVELRLLQHSFIRSAHVRRELNPPALILSIEERQPVAILRSDSTNETFLIDREGMLLRPRLIAGIRDPAQLLQVPLLSGVSERDTMAYQGMAKLVQFIVSLNSGSMQNAIGELRRTPTGDYVIYTTETQTPIFLGSPFDAEYKGALEEQTDTVPAQKEPLFDRQLRLLASVWKTNIQPQLRSGTSLYVDARFNGQVILKHKNFNRTAAPAQGTAVASTNLIANRYATNANERSSH